MAKNYENVKEMFAKIVHILDNEQKAKEENHTANLHNHQPSVSNENGINNHVRSNAVPGAVPIQHNPSGVSKNHPTYNFTPGTAPGAAPIQHHDPYVPYQGHSNCNCTPGIYSNSYYPDYYPGYYPEYYSDYYNYPEYQPRKRGSWGHSSGRGSSWGRGSWERGSRGRGSQARGTWGRGWKRGY